MDPTDRSRRARTVRRGLGLLAIGMTLPLVSWLATPSRAPLVPEEHAVQKRVGVERGDHGARDSRAVVPAPTRVPSGDLAVASAPGATAAADADGMRAPWHETHDADVDAFDDVRSFGLAVIAERSVEDRDFTENVLALARTELAQPRADVGRNLVGVESEEVRHARRVIAAVQEFEERGIMVELDELSYVRLDDDLSAGIFGEAKAFERVVSRRDDDGNEHLAMAVVPDERAAEPLSIRAPVSAGFSVEVISSTRHPYWTESSNGKIKGIYVKYRDFGERDPGADYYAYARWGDAEPAPGGFLKPKRYVRSADLKSGITDGSKWKVFAKLDYDPEFPVDAGGASCDNVTLEVNIGITTLGRTGEWCDQIEPRYVWGGLHTRYEPQRTLREGFTGTWVDHYDRQVRNNFLVSVSVRPGTEPYWWDYTDAYFCSEFGSCSEPTQRD